MTLERAAKKRIVATIVVWLFFLTVLVLLLPPADLISSGTFGVYFSLPSLLTSLACFLLGLFKQERPLIHLGLWYLLVFLSVTLGEDIAGIM
jgi:hypothetical protein